MTPLLWRFSCPAIAGFKPELKPPEQRGRKDRKVIKEKRHLIPKQSRDIHFSVELTQHMPSDAWRDPSHNDLR